MPKKFLVTLSSSDNREEAYGDQWLIDAVSSAIVDLRLGVSYKVDTLPEEDIDDPDYRMDPKTDDLIYAKDLQNGMRVLVASRDARVGHVSNKTGLELARERNRWCTVTQIEPDEIDNLRFIGVYDDGRKAIRGSHNLDGWLVKKDTLSAKDPRYETCEFWDVDCGPDDLYGDGVHEVVINDDTMMRLLCGYHIRRVTAVETEEVKNPIPYPPVGRNSIPKGAALLNEQAKKDMNLLLNRSLSTDLITSAEGGVRNDEQIQFKPSPTLAEATEAWRNQLIAQFGPDFETLGLDPAEVDVLIMKDGVVMPFKIDRGGIVEEADKPVDLKKISDRVLGNTVEEIDSKNDGLI